MTKADTPVDEIHSKHMDVLKCVIDIAHLVYSYTQDHFIVESE